MLSESSGDPRFSSSVACTLTVLQSATLLSMVNSFNTLLDSGCTHHVVRDRALFHDYTEKSISVDTANCGSLDALGSGDVEFRYPFGDRCVIFTLRGCLYAPTAPINLLSLGALVERGMSCLFSPGGTTKVFYPDHHPKLPGLTFSATVVNRLSFLLLDFIPPVLSSVPVTFPAQVSPPVAVPLPKSVFLPFSSSSSHRKSTSPPKKKPLFSNPHHLVIDATLPSHVFNDHSLFTTYVSARKIYRTALGTDIIVEGIGDVHLRVVVHGKSILFCFRDSWHVPTSPHHFFSCSTVISLGHQVMIAGRSPRMIYSHKRRLVEPGLPKYIPFTRLGSFIVLKFDIPVLSPQPALPTTQSTVSESTTQPVLSLQASSSPYCPFAGLTFNQNLIPTSHVSFLNPSVTVNGAMAADSVHRHADVIMMSGASENIVLHGGAELVEMDSDVCFSLNDVDVTSHGGADVQMMLPADVTVDGIVNASGVELEDQAADTCEGDPINQVRTDSCPLATLNSSLDSFDIAYAIILRALSTHHIHRYFSCTLPLIPTLNTDTPCFPYSLISFSCELFSCFLSAPFSALILSGSSFPVLILHLHATFSLQVFRCSNPSLFLFSSLPPSHESTIFSFVHFEFSFLPLAITIFLPTFNFSHHSPSRLTSRSLKTLAVSLHATTFQPFSGIFIPIQLHFSSSQSLFPPRSCTTTHDGGRTNLFTAYSSFPSHLPCTSCWVCTTGQPYDDMLRFCDFRTVDSECLGRTFHLKEPLCYVEVRSRPDAIVCQWRAAVEREEASLDEIGAFKEAVLPGPEGDCAIGLKRVFTHKTDRKESARVVGWGFHQQHRSRSSTTQPAFSPRHLPLGAAPSPFHSLFVTMSLVHLRALANYHGSRPISPA